MDFPQGDPLFRYVHKMRSRYGETDKMGYVYYARYLEYFEVARTEMVRELGMSYKSMEDDGVMLPVIHAELDYKNPIYYDEEMHIEVLIYEMPSVRLKTFYRVMTEKSDSPHVIGKVDLCFMRSDTRRPVKAPQEFLDGLLEKKHKQL